ncbi:MAG: molybdopterin-dependent oxidoreductase [Candidatus Omnitrophica bacterium]|nr:molybdopterin-dependent oxidoreductase [Candidatus Omnitrophota bacterium]
MQYKEWMEEHRDVTRRFFLGMGAVGIVGLNSTVAGVGRSEDSSLNADWMPAVEYLTRDENFKNYGRGNPPPDQLPLDKRRAVGLERDTWQLEVIADPESNSKIENPLSKELGAALDWKALMKLAETQAVRFLHVMACTNGRAPCGMGLWEGVPLREVIWMARPKQNIRRIFYYGYHNDDPKQRFQSSLPIGRVLEDPPGDFPVILCYKLNDKWLSPVRGGPVRMLVPDAYGNKSVKWLQRILLTNNSQANDTYALWNNDTESSLKTWACIIHAPQKIKSVQSIPISGIAQVGMSGLHRVQYWLHPQKKLLPENDPYFTSGDWKNAEALPPPEDWGGGLPNGKLPASILHIDPTSGKPIRWPLRNTLIHWAALMPAASPGLYDLRCRTIDANGVAQPMPRPFLKSGYNAIQKITLEVEA